jgi:hypothetical protein
MADQVEPEAGPLAFLADLRGRQPDLRDQGSPGELGQDSGVDLVGLGGQGGQAADPLGVRDQDLPAGELEGVMDKPGAIHRFDRGPDRLAFSGDPPSERSERIRVRRDGRYESTAAVLTQHIHVEPLSRQVQSGVQHPLGPPRCWLLDNPTVSPVRSSS